MTLPDPIATNRISWDARVPIHLRSALYRPNIEALRRGGDCLPREVAEEIGDIAGRDVLHLQCHIGLDTLSLARRGARATGLDFSQPAIEAARSLAEQLAIPARFVVAPVSDAPTVLPGENFDLVFATEGVLCWIPDLPQWMAIAAAMLRPGGRLYLMDGHPFTDLFEDDPTARHGIDLHTSYFDRGPHRYGPGATYADDGSGEAVPEVIEYKHTVGDILNAAISAGLCVERFEESARCGYQKFAAMTTRDGQAFDLPGPLREALPMSFSLTARKRAE